MAKKAYVWDGSSWIGISSTINGINDIVPSQTGNSGKFLTTNGSVVSWGTVDPSQIVTTNTVNAAAATQLGVVTSGTWSANNIDLSKGGTNASLSAVNGGVVYSTSSAMAITSAGTAGQVLTSNGSSAPTWQSPSTGFDAFLLCGM